MESCSDLVHFLFGFLVGYFGVSFGGWYEVVFSW